MGRILARVVDTINQSLCGHHGAMLMRDVADKRLYIKCPDCGYHSAGVRIEAPKKEAA